MIKYYSNITGEYYDSIKEAEMAEKAYEVARMEEERKKQVEEAKRRELEARKANVYKDMIETRKKYFELLTEWAKLNGVDFKFIYS